MYKVSRSKILVGLLGLSALSFQSLASDLIIPNQFTSGTRAVAADVNANFDAGATAVTDNQTQITDLIAQITALTAMVNTNSETIAANVVTITLLEAENASLQADSVAGLAAVLTVGTDNQGNTAAIFSGVNLHLNNASGETGLINGLGNLVVGYDEQTANSTETCSLGTDLDQTTCENNGAIWSISHKSGSHNIIVGTRHNYSRTGGAVFGINNNISGDYSSVLGGAINTAGGFVSSINGGQANTASGQFSSISGGRINTAGGTNSSISGGVSGTASGKDSTVTGGFNNIASGAQSSISGGIGGIASGTNSTVTGGFNNIASGTQSSVSGGSSGEAAGNANWVAGSLFEAN